MGDTVYKCIKCDYSETRKAGMIYPAIVPSHCGLVMQVVTNEVDQQPEVIREKRLPSSQSIRTMIQQLKGGVDEEEQETIEELLKSARQRVLAAIPPEILTVLQQLSPQLLEIYALLHQPIEKKLAEETQEISRTPNEKGSGPNIIQITQWHEREDQTPEMSVELTILPNSTTHVERGAKLYSPPPITDVMTLDPFQQAYKGLASSIQGRGKKAKTTSEVVAVHKAIFENELAKVGNAVRDPAYWLPKHNGMTVYFPGAQYEVEIAWLLGDYDPNSSGVPAGMNPTPEQIIQWFEEGLDDEDWHIEVIKRHLRTREQKVWLDSHDMSISDLLGGRYPAGLDAQWIFDDWNAKLGVKQFGFS